MAEINLSEIETLELISISDMVEDFLVELHKEEEIIKEELDEKSGTNKKTN